MYRLPWKTAYVTGGSSGIGYAVSKKLVEEGVDHLVLLARREDKLRAASESLKKECGLKEGLRDTTEVYTVSLDITDRKKVEELIPEIASEYGTPDLLVNSAGTAYPNYFEQISYERFKDTMEINIVGMWNVVQSAVPLMKKGGWIVNVSSIEGFIGTFGYTAYSASKFAVVGFSESLRNELSARGIGVSVLCPPDTHTPQLREEEATKPAEAKAIAGNVPAIEPEKVAEVLFKGLKKKRFFIVPGIQGKLLYWLNRVWPNLIYRIVDREVNKFEKRKRDKNGY
ncbi:MAG: SDR family oxidoreductase [Spirochaetia bacterium]